MIEYKVKVSDDGSKEWYLNGTQVSEKEFDKQNYKLTSIIIDDIEYLKNRKHD